MPTLEFKGKPFVYSHHLSVPFRQFVIDADKSLPSEGSAPSLDDNLIIHGDNLEALKALLPRYAGKVDVIYIDPPYNTGNEGWAYNDNVNAPQLRAWLGKVVDAEDMERHDKWLSMMWPRLQLLKELLSPNGYMFISIDDKEVHRLRTIAEEIGFLLVVELVWKSRKFVDARAKTGVSNDHEYILTFALDEAEGFRGVERDESKFSNPDGDQRGDWMSRSILGLANPEQRPNLHFEFTDPESGFSFSPPQQTGWRYSRERIATMIAEKRILFPATPDGRPREKKFRSEMSREFSTFPSIIDDVFTSDGTAEARLIIPEQSFDFPKPSQLVQRLLRQVDSNDALILDSFAGSGTTGHAVLALNKADGGNRKFILIETEDYADALTAERVRRVIKGVPGAKDAALKEGLGGSFTYCDLGEPMDLERFFGGEGTPPTFEQVADYVAYTATGKTLERASGQDGFVGHAGGYRLHLIYRPDPKWMRGEEAKLDLTVAERIAAAAKADGGKPVLVFAAQKMMGQRWLTDLGITFCQLPYSIHRILGDGSEGVSGVDAA
ncbi:site-specific DNA-methyltransferase [Enterovirga sp. GCM10030262]|uniref:site-specific DNA-methyltransferase n=1 Tax=Enterovirga sp. GCM10030262 TaxID=3273391 RepID=UPI00361722AB